MAIKLLGGIYGVQVALVLPSTIEVFNFACPLPADMAVLFLCWNSTSSRMQEFDNDPGWESYAIPVQTPRPSPQQFIAAQGGYNQQLSAATEVSCEAWYLPTPIHNGNYAIYFSNFNGYTIRYWLFFLKSDLSLGPVNVTYQGKVTATGTGANPSNSIQPTNNGGFACDIMAPAYRNAETARTQALLSAAYNEGAWNDSACYLEQVTSASATFGHTQAADSWAQILLAFNDGSAPTTPSVWLPTRQLALDTGAADNDHVVWNDTNSQWIDDVGYIDYVTSYAASYSTASSSWSQPVTQIQVPTHWCNRDVLLIISAQYIGKQDEYPGIGGTVGTGGIGVSVGLSVEPRYYVEWAQTQYANTLHLEVPLLQMYHEGPTSGTIYFRAWVRANSGTPRFTGITLVALLIGPGTFE